MGSTVARRRISRRTTLVACQALAADTDLEPVGIVVTAIGLVAVDAVDGKPCKLFEIGDDETECMTVIRICRAVQHELPSLWRGDRRNKRDLAAELVGTSCLAAADALHLGTCNKQIFPPCKHSYSVGANKLAVRRSATTKAMLKVRSREGTAATWRAHDR
jgi:hypothetical protein